MGGFFVSPRVAWGTGAIEQLSGLGVRRALLWVDANVARRDGHRRIVEELDKSDTTTEVEVAPAAPHDIPSVNDLFDRSRAHPPDAVVAVGGGRVIDAAKALRLRFERPELSLSEMPPLLDAPGTAARPMLVALPTTSGSGAEASWAADLRSADGTPVEVADRSLIPDWALVDPALAEGLPTDRLLDGGFETLALACESFVSAWANPFSDPLALHAAATVVERLPHAVRWSDDPDAHASLHYAATAAGLAAANAQRGLAHALARALEGPTELPYGRLIGIALPAVLEFDQPSARDRLETLGRWTTGPEERATLPLAQRLRRLGDQLGFPATIRAAGIPLERWDEVRPAVVVRALRSPGALANPRVASTPEVGALLDALVGP